MRVKPSDGNSKIAGGVQFTVFEVAFATWVVLVVAVGTTTNDFAAVISPNECSDAVRLLL